MKQMKAGEFKAKCLKVMDEVAETGEAIEITKRGVPVVRLVPAPQKPKTLRGAFKGIVKIKSDIISPIDVEWDVLK